jgi:hypothetical protein
MPTKTSTESPTWLMAREAVVVIVGARAAVPRTVVARDNRTGRLAEVPVPPPEAPWLDEGDDGMSYVFRRGERVLADHPAVLESPGSFVPYVPAPTE